MALSSLPASASIHWRMAEEKDAMAVAPLIVEASGGIVPYLLDGLLPGTPVELLVASSVTDAASPMGYPNILVGEMRGECAAILVGYDAGLFALPETMTSFVPAERLRALDALMHTPLPEDSFFIQCLAVDARYRRQGLGRELLAQAEVLAAALGFSGISLHVWADNAPALALYEAFGFRHRADIAMPQAAAMGRRGGKILLYKPLENVR